MIDSSLHSQQLASNLECRAVKWPYLRCSWTDFKVFDIFVKGIDRGIDLMAFGVCSRSLRASRRHANTMRRMRQTNPGQVPAQRPRQDVARELRPMLRLSGVADRKVFLAGREAVLQERLFQVSRLKLQIGPAKAVRSG